jgi:hypothetical protein
MHPPPPPLPFCWTAHTLISLRPPQRITAARLTNRTLLAPSFKAAHGVDMALGDVLDVDELRRYW